MTAEQPARIAITWCPEARADVRAIDRDTAMHCLDHFITNRAGDVKKLKAPLIGIVRTLPGFY